VVCSGLRAKCSQTDLYGMRAAESKRHTNAVSLPPPPPPTARAFVSESPGSVKFDGRLVGRTDGVDAAAAGQRTAADWHGSS